MSLLSADRIAELLARQLRGELRADEQAELDEWLSADERNKTVMERLEDPAELQGLLIDYYQRRAQMAAELQAAVPGLIISGAAPTTTSKVVPLLKRAWLRWAAAIVLLSGTVAYFYSMKREPEKMVTHQPAPVKDIAPGGQRAILTLGDGRVVVLDSAADGQLAEQGGSLVAKQNGQVIYKAINEPGSSEVVYNTMTTPTGGQYQLRLPDGTKVWLNAASSITYPVVFHSDKREVHISGEAYLEVAKDAKRPFLVDAGDAKIEVLGTSFDVNAYANEPAMLTTLIDGKIAVMKGGDRKVMAPGQQAAVAPNTFAIQKVNAADAVAWTKGFFSFHSADLPTVMRQLERWYGIAVKYQGPVPDLRFSGKLPMNSTLSQMIAGLSSMHLRFVLEGNTLLIQ